MFIRFLAFSAPALTVALGLTSCGGEDAGQTVAENRPTVAIVVSSGKVSAGKELGAGYRLGAATADVDVLVTGPPIADPPKQAEIFKDMTNRAKGGVAIQASSPELIADELAAEAKDGFPLIAVDIKPAATSGLKTYVGNDNHRLGMQLAEELTRRLPPDSAGTVVVGSTRPGLPVMEQRVQGIRDGFAATLPDVKVAGPFDTQTDASANLAAWKRLAAATRGTLALIGTGSTDGGSIAAVRASSGGKWLAAGFDLDIKALTGLKEGQLVAIASPEHYLTGAVAGALQARHAKDGAPVPAGWIEIPGMIVTSANVAEIMARQASEEDKATWFKPHLDKIMDSVAGYTKPLNQAR
jgi:ribose transport system substrate-binding protein